MHIHRPKPLHGWREFLNEVGIIVIGIGIALGAEQAIEAWHWHHVIAEESVALDADVADMWSAMTHRVAIGVCVDRRLADLAQVFARHDAGLALGLVAPVGRPARFTAGQTALAIATADQSLAHMAIDRKRAYFDVYGSYDTFVPISTEERVNWRTLQALNHADTLQPADWIELRKAYDAAVDDNVVMKANLRSGVDADWLSAFARFPHPPIDRRATYLPYEVQLCAPAVTR